MEHSVLIVEDDELLAGNIQTYLERKNFEALVCHSAEEALELLQDQVPDVLLTAYEPDVRLEVVKTDLDLKPVKVYLIWHQRTNAHPAHRWFRGFILEQYDRFNGKQQKPSVVASSAR